MGNIITPTHFNHNRPDKKKLLLMPHQLIIATDGTIGGLYADGDTLTMIQFTASLFKLQPDTRRFFENAIKASNEL